MRSSPSSPPDPLDPGPAGFAHRGLHGRGARENSLAAIEQALRIGAGIEIDVLLSSDGVPVLLHDYHVSRFGPSEFGDPRDVAAMTASDLGRARLGDGLPLASPLAEALALVAGRVPILIEAKADPERLSRPTRLAKAIANVVADYHGPLGVMSFHPLVPRWLARQAPAIRRGLVIGHRLPFYRRRVALALANPHFLAVALAEIDRPWVAAVRRRMPIYCWTIVSPTDRARGKPRADALIWDHDGRP